MRSCDLLGANLPEIIPSPGLLQWWRWVKINEWAFSSFVNYLGSKCSYTTIFLDDEARQEIAILTAIFHNVLEEYWARSLNVYWHLPQFRILTGQLPFFPVRDSPRSNSYIALEYHGSNDKGDARCWTSISCQPFGNLVAPDKFYCASDMVRLPCWLHCSYFATSWTSTLVSWEVHETYLLKYCETAQPRTGVDGQERRLY